MGIRLGKSEGWLYNVVKAEKMKENVYNLMLAIFDLPKGTFIKKKERKPEKKGADVIEGYQLTLDVRTDRLEVEMLYKGEKMYEAWAYIKGNTELDLVQAVSYAMHLIYKKAEQAELEGHINS